MLGFFNNTNSKSKVDDEAVDRKGSISIYNSKYSCAFQIVVTLATIIFLSTGATLTICLSFTYSLGSASYKLANTKIRDNTESNILNSALVIAHAIESEIRSIGSSVCLRGSKYSAALISNGTRIHNSHISTVLKPMDTFHEYNFLSGCKYPNCPKDYGPLVNKSRVSYPGSLLSSSLYVMLKNGSYSEALRTNSRYTSVFSSYPDAAAVVDVLSPQDLDLRTIFNFGSNSTEMFYLSALYPISYSGSSNPSGVPSGASYISLHRTFPGMLKNSSRYDPPSRPWFKDAPIGDFHIYGPYLETFTQLLSVTISSRTSTRLVSPSQGNKYITTVATSVILLKYLADIINGVEYPNSGKGILLNYQTLEVVVYGKFNAAMLYGATGFQRITDLDPNLAKFNLRMANNFEYTDSSGVNWIVATVPFLEHVTYSTGLRSYAFIMIVLSRSDEAFETLPELKKQITSTTSTILGVTISICVATALSLLTLVYFVVRWLAKPLDTIRSFSRQIVEISAEEENSRSYSKLIEEGQRTVVVRTDEIGSLVLYFWDMVAKLDLENVKKQKRNKYPPNPFFVPGAITTSGSFDASVKWPQFARMFYADQDSGLYSAIASTDSNDTGFVPPQLFHLSVKTKTDITADITEQTTTPLGNENGNGNEPNESGQENSSIVKPKYKWIPSSLYMYWYASSLLLMIGITVVMLATVYQLQGVGNDWMSNTGVSMTSKQVLYLTVFANAKAKFAKSFLVEMRVNLLCGAHFQTSVLDGNLTRANISTQDYFPSYSLDAKNYYASPSTFNAKFSGYFVNTSTNCMTQQKCAAYQYTQELKQTSLFDLQLQSYFHNYTKMDFLQNGFAQSGVTRIIPYSHKNYGTQQQCFIEDRSLRFCDMAYSTSKCAHPAFSNLTYPPYDPRCRSWYQPAVSGGDPNKMYVQYPRIASTGLLDITATTPLRKGISRTGYIYGVFNINVIMNFLADSVIKILDNGYCYLIDSTNPGQLIIHPKLVITEGKVASTLKSVEGFSDTEYQYFINNILNKLRNSSSITASYQKGGQTWYLSSSTFVVSAVAYSLIATVPLCGILQVSNLVQQQISTDVRSILLIFIYVLASFCVLLVVVALTVVRAVVQPLNDMRAICQKVASGDYDVVIPKTPSTLDLKMLLDAFSNMLVAIRFGGENFARGHLDIAQKVFQESLRIYTVLGNKRGIGVSQNNLGAVSLSRGDYKTAELYFRDAVANARSMIEAVTSWESTGNVQRILSDRLGNLAVAYMEQGRIEDAKSLLHEAMEEDRTQEYIRGYIVKQGTLGLLLLKIKDYDAATRVITDALQFAGSHCSGLLRVDEQWTLEEAAVTEQIALCNIGLLNETKGRIPEAEEAYIDSLTFHETMHVSTTYKALMALRNIFVIANRRHDVINLDRIAAAYNFKIKPTKSSFVKRIIFVLEMTNQVDKLCIKNTLLGARQLQTNCMTANDLCSIVHSVPGGVCRDFPLSKTSGREKVLDKKLNSFLTQCRTHGSPVDALLYAVDTLNDESLTVDWIMLCTDSSNFDMRSEAFKRLQTKLSRVVIGLVIINIGQSPSEVLHELVGSSRNGIYLHAKPDSKSIDESYVVATKFIQRDESYSKGQLMLEEV